MLSVGGKLGRVGFITFPIPFSGTNKADVRKRSDVGHVLTQNHQVLYQPGGPRRSQVPRILGLIRSMSVGDHRQNYLKNIRWSINFRIMILYIKTRTNYELASENNVLCNQVLG